MSADEATRPLPRRPWPPPQEPPLGARSERLLALALADPRVLRAVNRDVRRDLALCEAPSGPGRSVDDLALVLSLHHLRLAVLLRQAAPDAHLRGVIWRLNTMPPDTRLVVALVAGAGVDPEEVPWLLPMSRRQVRRRLRTALRLLGGHYGLRPGRDDAAILASLQTLAAERASHAGAWSSLVPVPRPATPPALDLARAGLSDDVRAPLRRPWSLAEPRTASSLPLLLAAATAVLAVVLVHPSPPSLVPSHRTPVAPTARPPVALPAPPAAGVPPAGPAGSTGPATSTGPGGATAPSDAETTAPARPRRTTTAPGAAPTSPRETAGRATLRPVASAAAQAGLLSVWSGRCLEVPPGNRGTVLFTRLGGCDGSTGQQVGVSGSTLLVRDGMCLDAAWEGTVPGTRVGAWPCQGSPNQVFEVLPDGRVRGVQSGLCLSTEDRATTDGTLVVLDTCGSDPLQVWQLG